MAIDTATKRASIAAIGLMRNGPTVVPSGSFDQADRQVIGYSYSGILATASAVSEGASTSLSVTRSARAQMSTNQANQTHLT
jgi:hypothetical protein